MASRRHADPGTSKGLPGYAKTIILLQGFVIAFLSLWIFEEYLNNQYFQQYVNNAFRTNGEAYVLLPSFVLAILAVVAYAKIRNPNGRREMAVRVGHFGPARGKRQEVAEITIGPTLNTFPPAPIATPALATAATRVLKRIALGMGSSEKPSVKNTMPLLEKVEQGDNPEDETRIQTRPSALKRVELQHGSVDKSFSENRSIAPLGAEPRHLSTASPSFQKTAPVPGRAEPRYGYDSRPSQERFHAIKRVNPSQGLGGRPFSQNPLTAVTGSARGDGPRDELSAQESQPDRGGTATRRGPEHGPMAQLRSPAPLKQVKVGRGPLDDPLPENSLVPVLKHLPPAHGREGPQAIHRTPLLRRLERGQAPESKPLPQSPALIPRTSEQASSVVDKAPYHNLLPVSRPVELQLGPRFRQLPQNKASSLGPFEQEQRLIQKPSSSIAVVPRYGAPSPGEKPLPEKRPLIPEPFGQRQGQLEKVSPRKIEAVLKNLERGRGSPDNLSNQEAGLVMGGVEPGKVPGDNSLVQKPMIVSKRVEPGQSSADRRQEEGRPALNRVEPLPGAADNAWARKFPRVREHEEPGSRLEEMASSDKHAAPRKKAAPRNLEEGRES